MRRSTRLTRFHSILCPVDFSEPSRDAIRYAADIARRGGGRLTALFVNDPLLLAAAAAVYHRRREFLQRAQMELERFVRRSIAPGRRPRGDMACAVAQGDPAEEILRAAKRLRSDVIVMGTHGLSGVERLFFGSTTEQVLRRVTAPVLAVPRSKALGKSRRRPRRHGPGIARVIAPLDLDGDWTRDVSGAADVARWFGAELLLVYVVPRLQVPPWLRPNVEAHDRIRAAEALGILEQVRTTLPAGVRSACRVLVGNPADEIAAVAAKGPESLVAMSLRSEDRFFDRRGAIAYRVLTGAVAPVLALPRLARPHKSGAAGSTNRVRQMAAALRDAAAGALMERDRMEMAAVDAVLSAGRRRAKGRGPSRPRHRES
jgi:nucleotide-binding universal stress UspA family protein